MTDTPEAKGGALLPCPLCHFQAMEVSVVLSPVRRVVDVACSNKRCRLYAFNSLERTVLGPIPVEEWKALASRPSWERTPQRVEALSIAVECCEARNALQADEAAIALRAMLDEAAPKEPGT